MGQRWISQKLKSFGSFLLILILLPYVITVFIHGADIKAVGNDSVTYVKVKETTQSGEEQIAEISWEEYFIGVLAREIPDVYEDEFLKAQAVVIRTNLYQALANNEDKVLEEEYLKPEDLEKKLGGSGFAEKYESLEKAIEATGNQVLLYQEAYAYTPFHQASNGMTRSAQEVLGAEQYPYLAPRECPLDKEAEDEMQTVAFTYQDVQKKCQSFLVAVDESQVGKTYEFTDFEILSYDSAGYVAQMRIGDTVCTGDRFRDALSLASSSFSLQDADGKLRITTTGKGHGLGMSQWTANEMAKEGKNYEEILQYFYEGTNLADGGEVASVLQASP